MNKQRVLIMAMMLAAAIAAALLLVPGLKGSRLAQVVYFPSVLMAMLFSGGEHSPSATAWNSAFATWSITYLFLVVALYALLLELYLLLSVARSLGWPEQVVGAPPEAVDDGQPADAVGFATARAERAPGGSEAHALASHLGQSLQAHERRRRSHWLLAPRKIDLEAPPADAARMAVDTQAAPRATAWMLRRLEAQGKATIGADKAQQAVTRAFGKRG